MPIYEYICEGCGDGTEAVQKISDPPLSTCLKCNGTLKRIISKTSFQLKGAGWYASDYKKAPSKAAAQPSKASAEAPGENKSGEAPETKPSVSKKE